VLSSVTVIVRRRRRRRNGRRFGTKKTVLGKSAKTETDNIDGDGETMASGNTIR